MPDIIIFLLGFLAGSIFGLILIIAIALEYDKKKPRKKRGTRGTIKKDSK